MPIPADTKPSIIGGDQGGLDADPASCAPPSDWASLNRGSKLSQVLDQDKMPKGLVNLLDASNFSHSQEPTIEDLNTSTHIINRLKQTVLELGYADDGKVTNEEMEELVDLLQRLGDAKKNDSSHMEYGHLPEGIRKVFEQWDDDKSGTVCITELTAAAHAWQQVHEEHRMMKQAIFAMAIVILILFIGMFALSFLAAQLAKDTGVSDSGLMKTRGGSTVQVASSDYSMGPEGEMVIKRSDGEAVPANSSESNTVSTSEIKTKLVLSSTLSDKQFSRLKQVTLHSDAGATINIDVQGFMRVPTPGSKCGNVVYLITTMGRIMFDQSDISFEAHASLEKLNELGFSLSIGGLGRRLQSTQAATGFFNKVEASADNWKCSDVPLPKTPANYMATKKTYQPCGETDSTAKCQSRYGGLLPGVRTIPEDMAIYIQTDTERASARIAVDESGVPVDEVDRTDVPQLIALGKMYKVNEERVVDGAGYNLRAATPPLHFGQTKITLTDKAAGRGYAFQAVHSSMQAFFNGAVSGTRLYCRNNTNLGDSRRLRERRLKEGQNLITEESAAEEVFDIEYKGLWVENGKSYRHWRMRPKEGKASDYYEYWDVPGSLHPHRLVAPDGVVTAYHDVSAATDSDVTEYLGTHGFDLSAATAPGCFTESAMSDGVVPVINNGESELLPEDADLYLPVLLEAGNEAKNDDEDIGDLHAALLDYLSRATNSHSISDTCAMICGIATSQEGATCPISAEQYNCLLSSGVDECTTSSLVENAESCGGHGSLQPQGNSSRRLQLPGGNCPAGTTRKGFDIGAFALFVCTDSNGIQGGKAAGEFQIGPFSIGASGEFAMINGALTGSVSVSIGGGVHGLAHVSFSLSFARGWLNNCLRCTRHHSRQEDRSRRRCCFGRRRRRHIHTHRWTSQYQCNCEQVLALTISAAGAGEFLGVVEGSISASYSPGVRRLRAWVTTRWRPCPSNWCDWRNGGSTDVMNRILS